MARVAAVNAKTLKALFAADKKEGTEFMKAFLRHVYHVDEVGLFAVLLVSVPCSWFCISRLVNLSAQPAEAARMVQELVDWGSFIGSLNYNVEDGRTIAQAFNDYKS